MGVGVCGWIALAGCGGSTPAPFTPPPSGVIYRNDFTSSSLDSDWTERGSASSLTAQTGYLRLLPVAPDDAASDADQTAILRSADGDFVLLTRLLFTPVADRQLAGLVVEGTDGRTVSFGLLRAVFPQGTFIGLSAVAELAGGVEPETAFVPLEATDLYLRIAASGGTFSLAYSLDGTQYTSVTSFSPGLSADVLVGVGNVVRENCTESCAAGSAADFDFFEIGTAPE